LPDPLAPSSATNSPTSTRIDTSLQIVRRPMRTAAASNTIAGTPIARP